MIDLHGDINSVLHNYTVMCSRHTYLFRRVSWIFGPFLEVTYKGHVARRWISGYEKIAPIITELVGRDGIIDCKVIPTNKKQKQLTLIAQTLQLALSKRLIIHLATSSCFNSIFQQTRSCHLGKHSFNKNLFVFSNTAKRKRKKTEFKSSHEKDLFFSSLPACHGNTTPALHWRRIRTSV